MKITRRRLVRGAAALAAYTALPDWSRGGIPVPSIAAANGYNTRILFDHFNNLNNIDINATYGPGYLWYIHKAFPLAPEDDWHTNGTIPGNSFTISSPSVLKLANISGNHWTASIDTCVTNNAGNALIGRTIGNGFYAEARVMYDPALQGNSSSHGGTVIQGWPSFWTYSADFLGGTLGPTGHGIENDFLEAQPVGINPSGLQRGDVLERTYSGGVGTVVAEAPGQGFTSTPLNGNWQTISSLWLPINRPGTDGNGYVQHYTNGVEDFGIRITYTSSGSFAAYEGKTFGLFANEGNDWPIYIDYIGVWARNFSSLTVL